LPGKAQIPLEQFPRDVLNLLATHMRSL